MVIKRNLQACVIEILDQERERFMKTESEKAIKTDDERLIRFALESKHRKQGRSSES